MEEELATYSEFHCRLHDKIRLYRQKDSVVDLVDDGSRILKMKNLVDRLMIYRDTGYMTAIGLIQQKCFSSRKDRWSSCP